METALIDAKELVVWQSHPTPGVSGWDRVDGKLKKGNLCSFDLVWQYKGQMTEREEQERRGGLRVCSRMLSGLERR